MSDIKTTIAEQLQQLQMLMHRASFQSFMGDRMQNPYRGQGRVLAILKMKPEISQKELGFLLNMSKQALAELLAKLEKSGYITREPSQEDKRVLTIKLTESGMNAAGDVGEGAPETAKIFDCLSDEELAAFRGYLARIIERYEDLFPGEDFKERLKMMEAFMHRYGRGFGGHHGRPGGFGGPGPCGGFGGGPDFGEGPNLRSGFGNGPDFGEGPNLRSGFGNGPDFGEGPDPRGFGNGPDFGESPDPRGGFGDGPGGPDHHGGFGGGPGHHGDCCGGNHGHPDGSNGPKRHGGFDRNPQWRAFCGGVRGNRCRRGHDE